MVAPHAAAGQVLLYAGILGLLAACTATPLFAPQPAQHQYSGPATAPLPVADPLVRASQIELIRLGFLRDVADGILGPKTHAAITSFQQANGLTVDGSPSPRLLALLQSTPTSEPAPTAAAPTPWVAPVGSDSPPPAPALSGGPVGWVQPAPTTTP
jgi:peptidoglycan hydrolase-like protein with peptidoglycan-binding domain